MAFNIIIVTKYADCAQAACQKNTTQASWSSCQMPSTARQLRQPLTIEAVNRGQHFADVAPGGTVPYNNYFNLYRPQPTKNIQKVYQYLL